MPRSKGKSARKPRRFFSEEFKQEAVQMLLDGLSALSVAERLGLPGPQLLYRWKKDALRQAIRARQPPVGLIHHSDRGGQYAGHDYRGLLRRAAMRQSMSRKANCYDNAFIESCFGTIKTELEMTEYEDSHHAHREIASYLTCYNYERRHSSLAYLTPVEFEAQLTPGR